MDNRTHNRTFNYGAAMMRRRGFMSESPEINQISFISILVILPLVLITNVAFIVGIFRTERKLSVTNRLFVYLSLLDLASIPLILVSLFLFDSRETYFASGLSSLEVFIRTNGLLTFQLISILRCVSILRPLRPLQNSTIIGLLIVDLLISVSLAIALHINLTGSLTMMNRAYGNLIPVLLFSVVNISTLIANLKCKAALSRNSVRNAVLRLNSRSCKNNIKAMDTIVFISIFYTIHYIPFCIFSICLSTFIMTDRLLLYVKLLKYLKIFVPFLLSNNAVNTLILSIRNSKIRNFYKNTLGCGSTPVQDYEMNNLRYNSTT